jgi:hypothetical protein
MDGGWSGKGDHRMSKRVEDELEPSSIEADCPRDRALIERLCSKLLRLDREAMDLAATMRQKLKSS